MNSISPLNLSFSGIKSITYRKGWAAPENQKPDCRLSEKIMKAITDSDVIQNIAKKEDINLSLATIGLNLRSGKAAHALTINIPNRGYVNLWLNNTHLAGSCERIKDDLRKIPSQTIKRLIDLSSKFSKKLDKAENLCAEMNKTAPEKIKYHTITPEKRIAITPNLAISTKDIAIAEGIKGRTTIRKIIDVAV